MEIATTTKIESCDLSSPVDISQGEIADFEYSKIDCTATTTVEATSSTYPVFSQGFTQGEMINSVFLFMIFLVVLFSASWFGVIKPHAVRNKQRTDL